MKLVYIKSGYLLAILLFILLISSPTGKGETVEFSTITGSIAVSDTNSDSDTISLTIESDPDLPDGAVIEVSLSDQIKLNDSSDNGLVSDQRLLEFGRIIKVVLVEQGTHYQLTERTVESGAWTHFGHVMISWPFCQGVNCVPDEKGFAVGAKQDVQILSSLVSIIDDNKTHTVEIAEQVINTLHGTETDFDGDGIGINPTDGYGLTNYTIGMRDHIFNTRAAISDTTSDMYTKVSAILNEIDSVIYDDDPINPSLDNLNSSNKLYPAIYQIASSIIDNPISFSSESVSNLTSTIQSAFEIITEKYYEYRSAVFDFEFTISNISITLSGSTSNENDSDFSVLGMVMASITVPVVTFRRKFTKI